MMYLNIRDTDKINDLVDFRVNDDISRDNLPWLAPSMQGMIMAIIVSYDTFDFSEHPRVIRTEVYYL